MRKIKILLLSLAITLSVAVSAQNNKEVKPPLRVYSSFSYNNPLQGMDRYDYGFGVLSNFDYNFNEHFAARLDIGWNDYSGPEKQYVDQNGNTHTDHPNMSVWEFTAGLRASLGPVYLEGRGGYYTGIDSWGYVPAVGIVFWKLDLQAAYTIVGDKQWATIRLGYYF